MDDGKLLAAVAANRPREGLFDIVVAKNATGREGECD
jgi:hypothetical protein